MNSYEYEEEREIDLRNLIMYVLLRWRSILIVALIGALLGGAVSYFRSAKAIQGTEESAAEYEALLEQKEESLSGAEAAVAGMEQIIDRTSRYILTAPLMQIDPYHTWTASGSIRVSADQSEDNKLPADAAERCAEEMTRNMWASGEMADLAEKLRTDPSYLAELISVSVRTDQMTDQGSAGLLELILEEIGQSAYVDISAIGPDEETAEEIYHAAESALLSYQSPDNELQIAMEPSVMTITSVVRSDLLQKQNTTYYSLKDYNDRLTNLNTTLSKLHESSPESNTGQFTGGHISKKLVLLGFVGAGFLICLFYLMRYVLQDLIRTESDLTGLLKVKILGRFVKPEARKPLGGIDQLIRRIGGAPKPVSDEDTYRMIETNIRNYTEAGRKLLITGSGEAGSIEELGGKIRDCLGDTYSFTISPDILHNAESRQALAACDGVILIETVDHSKYAEVGEETRLIRGMNKEIVGSVLV